MMPASKDLFQDSLSIGRGMIDWLKHEDLAFSILCCDLPQVFLFTNMLKMDYLEVITNYSPLNSYLLRQEFFLNKDLLI